MPTVSQSNAQWALYVIILCPLNLRNTLYNNYRSVTEIPSTPNEALVRCFINPIICQSIFEEKAELKKASKIHTAISPNNSPTPTTPVKQCSSALSSFSLNIDEMSEAISIDSTPPLIPITLQVETPLNRVVSFEGKDHILSGKVDYSLGYYDKGHYSRKSDNRGSLKETPLCPAPLVHIWGLQFYQD